MAKKPPAPKKPSGLAQALSKSAPKNPSVPAGPRPSAQKPPTSGIVTPPKGPKGPQGQQPYRDVPKGYKPNWQGDIFKKDSPYKPLMPGTNKLPMPGTKPSPKGTPLPTAPKKKSAAPKPSGSVIKKK